MKMRSLQGKTITDVQKKIKTSYWPAMKMNWKVWTPFQFININYIPVQVKHKNMTPFPLFQINL